MHLSDAAEGIGRTIERVRSSGGYHDGALLLRVSVDDSPVDFHEDEHVSPDVDVDLLFVDVYVEGGG